MHTRKKWALGKKFPYKRQTAFIHSRVVRGRLVPRANASVRATAKSSRPRGPVYTERECIAGGASRNFPRCPLRIHLFFRRRPVLPQTCMTRIPGGHCEFRGKTGAGERLLLENLIFTFCRNWILNRSAVAACSKYYSPSVVTTLTCSVYDCVCTIYYTDKTYVVKIYLPILGK